MSETITNLKVRFGADTKNFKQDLESGKAAVTNFTGQAGNAFSQFAAIFGVNMSAISGSLGAANKSLSLLSGGFKGAAVSSGILSGALRILKLALISTGVGALIVGLGTLVSYFTKTERGAEFVERAMAGIKATFSVLIDRASAFGEGLFKIFSGDFKGGWEALKNSTKGIGTEIKNESAAAVQLERDLQALEDKEIALIEVQGKRRQKIEELRLAAKDLDLSAVERRKALAEAIQTEKDLTTDEINLQKERSRILEAQINLGESRDEDYRNLAETKAKTNDLEAQSLANQRAMTREYNKLTNEINKQSEALDAESDSVRLNRIEKEKAASKDLSTIAPYTKETKYKVVTDAAGNKDIIKDFDALFDENKLQDKADKIKSIYGDLKSSVIDFSQVFSESMSGIAVSFGESLGNMLNGTGTLDDIGKAVLTSLADLAITIGKIAIGVGIATFGIKTALESLNPVVAIAAGIALVALGTAAKGALSKAGSGGGTFSTPSTSTSSSGVGSSGSSSSYRAAPLTIYVTGEFRQRGTDLVAVIDKNTQRKVIGT